MKVIQASFMCNMLKYLRWMMQTATINLIVLLMFSNVYHSVVTRPHLGGCFFTLIAIKIHKHNYNLMNEYRSPNIFKILINRSKSVQKSQVALPPPNAKQTLHNSKLSPWFETMSKSNCKWNPNFSSNFEMRGEVVLFLYELILEGSRHSPHTISIIIPKCILELEATKHSFQSSKTNLWFSNLS